MLPQADIPNFVKAETPLSPIDLYQKFKATDAKALASIQAIAALNIHLGGDISKKALTEFLRNLTFQVSVNKIMISVVCIIGATRPKTPK